MRDPLSETTSFLKFDIGERRAEVIRAAEERAAMRRSQLDAQSSPATTAEQRIRLWEQLHGLSLPRRPDHKLVRVIATDTALSIRQVHDEQNRRAQGTTAVEGVT